jgi:hypothetical protein
MKREAQRSRKTHNRANGYYEDTIQIVHGKGEQECREIIALLFLMTWQVMEMVEKSVSAAGEDLDDAIQYPVRY